jgi:hypothetical protein
MLQYLPMDKSFLNMTTGICFVNYLLNKAEDEKIKY